MIRCYTGVPGSGKTYHAIKVIVAYLQAGKYVISNFPIKVDAVKKNQGRYFYVPNEKLNVGYFLSFSKFCHKSKEENQSLIVIDEASIKFNSRTFMDKDRLDFLSFFALHRHYGFNVILISQSITEIDRQIRNKVEIEVLHRNLKNYKLFRVLPFKTFVSIEKNTSIKDKNESNFFFYNKKIGSLYDTFYNVDNTSSLKASEDFKTDIIKSELRSSCRK